MLDERLAVAEADGKRAQMHVVEHLLGFLEAAHLERDNAAESRHFADGHGVIGMVLQTGIEHFLHILGAGKEVHHFLRVCTDGVHAHLERLETAQDQKRLLRPEHCARNVLESDHADLVHDLLARRREARDHVAVAVEILGRAVHDDIRAQLQRLHQQRRGKGVVHDDEAVRILRMRVVRDGAKRLYQQIYAQLRAQIFSGEIAAGQPLPSYRFMSRKYQVNVATVEKAYDLLEANGYIRRCQGSGCCVLPLDNFKFFADGVVLDSFQAGQSETGPVYDFATSTPLATREETRQFVALADELAQQRPDALLRYPPTRRRCGSIWPRAASRPRMRIFLSSTAASRASTSSARRLSARIRSCSPRTPAIRSRCIASSAPVRG